MNNIEFAPINWSNLIFGYTETDINVRCSYKNGEWGALRLTTDKTINISIAATCLQYAQEAFEGLKAFRGIDGKVRLFRYEENAKRLQQSADGMLMPRVPIPLFEEAIMLAVQKNLRFVPPYQSGASLYIRPILIGTSPKIGVSPGEEYEFIVIVSPVGAYFKAGFGTTPFIIVRQYDRAAPLGTGCMKVGGNYASGFRADQYAHSLGASCLYLDAKEKRYIDECSGANFFCISGNTYHTPLSDSILPSITNRSLMQLATDLGMQVEHRKIAVEELANMTEAGSCGTGAVISPISKVIDPDNDIIYTFGNGEAGPWSTKLYHALRDIQYGRAEDKYHWCTIVK